LQYDIGALSDFDKRLIRSAVAIMKPNTKNGAGQQIIKSSQEFVEALESGADISAEFRCRTVEVPRSTSVPASEQVKATRKLLEISQGVFAKFLGIPVGTVKAWEKGVDKPTEIACRFMEEMRINPDHWRKRLRETTFQNGQP
jgi:DNA-binding transcriptional regulator YiaG